MKSDKTLILGSSGFLGGYFRTEFGESAVSHTSKNDLATRAGARLLVASLETREDVKRLLSKTEFSKVIESLGKPDKVLDITERQKDSGFKMYLWNATPRIVCVFYKNKLISKL